MLDGPESTSDRGNLVRLDRDHPGFRDLAYRTRRDAIAREALAWTPGSETPRIAYTEAEHGVWRIVWQNLDPLHQRYACSQFFDGARLIELDRERVPQLAWVNARLAPLTGFSLAPVAGLVAPGVFLRHLGEREFLATQYMRHPSTPLYTPEPDVVHELVGHSITLAHPLFADLNRCFGEAALRLSDDAMERLVRVYWYTLEFGAAREGDRLEVYGAGLLSSFGELGRFETQAELLDFDLDVMGQTPFDPTDYQRRIFVAPSFAGMASAVRDWLDQQR